jgi:hypothetical protein
MFNLYLIYIITSITITKRVGGKLRNTGLAYLTDHFKENEPLALNINNLLMLGFYLINMGYILLVLNIGSSFGDNPFNEIAHNLGFVILLLGIMHGAFLRMLINLKPGSINNLLQDGQ